MTLVDCIWTVIRQIFFYRLELCPLKLELWQFLVDSPVCVVPIYKTIVVWMDEIFAWHFLNKLHFFSLALYLFSLPNGRSHVVLSFT